MRVHRVMRLRETDLELIYHFSREWGKAGGTLGRTNDFLGGERGIKSMYRKTNDLLQR